MSNRWLVLGCLLATGGAQLVDARGARADIKYTQEMRMADAGEQEDGVKAPLNKTTTYVKQGAQRVETTTQIGTAHMTDVVLTLCEKQQYVRLNPKLKVYTVAPWNDNAAPAADGAAPDAQDDNASGTGKVVTTYGLQDLGEETVAGFKTRHYMVSMRIQSSGCPGDNDSTMKMEIWVADIKDAHACGFDAKDIGRDYRPRNPKCKVTYEQKGDVDALTKAYGGLVMRMKIYNGDKVSMVQEITMLSQAKLDDTPFAIPADYKQVSEQGFQQKQTEAMMQAMTGQANAEEDGADNGGADAGDDANNATDDEPKDEAKQEDEAEKEEPKKETKPAKQKLPKLKLPF